MGHPVHTAAATPLRQRTDAVTTRPAYHDDSLLQLAQQPADNIIPARPCLRLIEYQCDSHTFLSVSHSPSNTVWRFTKCIATWQCAPTMMHSHCQAPAPCLLGMLLQPFRALTCLTSYNIRSYPATPRIPMIPRPISHTLQKNTCKNFACANRLWGLMCRPQSCCYIANTKRQESMLTTLQTNWPSWMAICTSRHHIGEPSRAHVTQ
jgi:hypothetical protein